MQSPKLKAFHRMYWVFFLIKQRLYQMTYLKFNTDIQPTTWPPGSFYHRIVGNIFIQQYIHADVSLNTKVLESIGSTNLTTKGLSDDCT